MDQAISLKNLNAILTRDREKGGNLEERFIPNAFKIRFRLYKVNKFLYKLNYKKRRGKISLESFEKREVLLNKMIERHKGKYIEFINNELKRIASIISQKEFRISLKLLPNSIAGKNVYGVGNTLDQVIAIRFVQVILKTLYNIRMQSRDILVSQIKSLALDGMPKFIIRSDVESFYESVRHEDLLDIIHKSPELSVLIKRILTRLLMDYSELAGCSKGIPRGIGISAYLSEIYMESIDGNIRKSNDLFYYARYVDDMILMYSPQVKSASGNYLDELIKILDEKGLKCNSKTKAINLLEKQQGKFDYLGYSFDASSSSVGVTLAQSKFNKYKSRIEKAFNDYSSKSKYVPKKASEELMLRCLFLTGNMRLFNRKSNAFIGVYFSNKYITDTAQLKGLDNLYQSKINAITDPRLKRKLLKQSFEKGFDKKIFRSFNAKQLSEISQGWNHA